MWTVIGGWRKEGRRRREDYRTVLSVLWWFSQQLWQQLRKLLVQQLKLSISSFEICVALLKLVQFLLERIHLVLLLLVPNPAGFVVQLSLSSLLLRSLRQELTSVAVFETLLGVSRGLCWSWQGCDVMVLRQTWCSWRSGWRTEGESVASGGMMLDEVTTSSVLIHTLKFTLKWVITVMIHIPYLISSVLYDLWLTDYKQAVQSGK